jgi:glycosyltransferase involved in cell wall biosynthesis
MDNPTHPDRELSILHVSHNHHIDGGSDRYFFQLNDLLVQQGHKVVPFCAADPRNLESPYSGFFPKTVDPESSSLSNMARYIFSRSARESINRLLCDETFDIAHLHIYYGKLTGSILKPLKERGMPIVQTLHEYKLLCPVYTMIANGKVCEDCVTGQLWRALPKRCNKNSFAKTLLTVIESYAFSWLGALETIDHFIGVSQFISDKMIEHGLPEDKITTIHNFIDSSRYRPAKDPGDYVLYFGRLERVKGIFTLLDAMKVVPHVECVIAGNGGERREIERYLETNDIHNVRLVGFVHGNALQDLIRGSLCTVIPSEWYENCPMSVLESLALARPVIGTVIGGIPELISHNSDGLLIQPGDAEALADSILRFAGDPAISVAMGAAGRRKIETCFNERDHYEKLYGIYHRLVAANP